jgi:hypothetical protein
MATFDPMATALPMATAVGLIEKIGTAAAIDLSDHTTVPIIWHVEQSQYAKICYGEKEQSIRFAGIPAITHLPND